MRLFMPRSLSIISASLVLIALTFVKPASAQTSYEVTGSSNTGYTSNRNPGTVADPQPDAFFEIGAGVGFRSVNGRTLQALRYELTGTIFAQELGAASFQNALDYLSLYDLSRRLRLGIGASGRQGRQGSFRVNPTEQVVEPRRPGTVWFVGLSAQQRLDFLLDSNWGLFQTAQMDWFIPTNNPLGDEGDIDPNGDSGRAASFEGGLGGQYSWRRFALGVSQRSQYLVNFLRIGNQATWLFTLSGTLRWDLSRRWTANFEAGAQLSVEGDLSALRQPGPLARGTLVYRQRRWTVDLAAGYQQTPSVQVAQILEGAAVALRASIPVGRPRLRMWVEGALGYTYSSPIGDIAAAEAIDIHTVGTDVAFNWRFSEMMEAAVRYQFGVQRSVGLSLLTVGEYAQDFSAHVAMLSLRFNYPPRRRRGRPRRRLGGPTRVDREEWDAVFDPTPGRSRDDTSTSQGGGSSAH